MWRALVSLAILASFWAQAAAGQAPDHSLRPVLRPGSAVASPVSPALPAYNVVVRYDARVRPRLRPGTVAAIPQPAPQPVRNTVFAAGAFGDRAVARSLRPHLRPASFAVMRAAPSTPLPPVAAPKPTGKFGAICGSRAIRGQRLSAIPGKLRGCGQAKPVKVSEVSGVRLSPAAIMDCTTASALDKWVRKGVVPAVGRLGGGPAELKVAAGYSCRTRNNKPGAKISEHGRGKAVDISGLTLKNGVKISVLKGWRDPIQGKILKEMHSSACGTFGTVLGPNSDRYHKDHLHLDTASYRGGAYCR